MGQQSIIFVLSCGDFQEIDTIWLLMGNLALELGMEVAQEYLSPVRIVFSKSFSSLCFPCSRPTVLPKLT